MPQGLITKIDRAISLAEKDSISTVQLAALVDLLNKAFKYSSSVSQERFSLHEASVTALNNCDAALKRFLSSRLMKEEEQAKEELESCENFAGGLTTYIVYHVSLHYHNIIVPNFKAHD